MVDIEIDSEFDFDEFIDDEEIDDFEEFVKLKDQQLESEEEEEEEN